MQLSTDKILGFSFLAATIVGCLALLLMTQRESNVVQSNITAQKDVESILTKLQSRDESEVSEAKAELAEMGEAAIVPLLSLLKDLTDVSVESLGTGSEETVERKRRVADRQTASRSANDIYEILGRLHAVEAVPLLVAIMEQEEIDNMIQGMSPVMRALAKIGPGAVPQLTMSIDGARSTILPSLSPLLTEEDRQINLGWYQGRIELRGTLVLQEIGDPTAIPVLERLQATSDNQFIVDQAREAIAKIQAKSGH